MEKVERLLNEYRADDLGVAGVAETLAALSNGQVEEAFLRYRTSPTKAFSGTDKRG